MSLPVFSFLITKEQMFLRLRIKCDTINNKQMFKGVESYEKNIG